MAGHHPWPPPSKQAGGDVAEERAQALAVLAAAEARRAKAAEDEAARDAEEWADFFARLHKAGWRPR